MAIFLVLQEILVWIDLTLLKNGLAQFSGNLLGLAVDQNRVMVPTGSFEIDNLCTGLLSVSVLAAVVFSLSKPRLKQKILLFAAGGIVLFLFNIPRLILVLWIGKEFGLAAAELVHHVSWVSTSVLILAAWCVGTKRIANIKNFGELL